LFVEANGMKRVLIPDPVEDEVEGTQKYLGSSGPNHLQVDIVEQFCADTMSEERYTNQVTVTHNKKRFTGCGRSLDYPWK
jgi:uncharacterized membrane protein